MGALHLRSTSRSRGKQRFYKEVGVVELQEKDIIKARDNRVTQWICKLSKSLYCVTLDGRKLRTPGRHPMVIPSQSWPGELLMNGTHK